MPEFLRNKLVQVVFPLLGAPGGFLYWKNFGCESGTCTIKSVWYWSTLLGATAGYLIGDLIVDLIRKLKRKKRKNDEH